ncbi:MAG: DUF1015 domain-containing protein [Elusimicrobia bacterium]|nr:DUF1015 domain-containing protein [Elusimicrobiota bacterium]
MATFFDDIGLQVPTVLLPAPGVDLKKWAVVACDQYTSEPAYWQRVRKFAGSAPSTLNITLPEILLEAPGLAGRIAAINRTMRRYVAEGVLREQKPGLVLVDRRTVHAKSRKGMLAALDLERYDFRKGSQTLIRATEGTILARIPPRVRIRKNASLELPHIMVLIDDPERTVIEPLFKRRPAKLYDTDLMLGAGHVKGYLVDDPAALSRAHQALLRLADRGRFAKKYGARGKGVLLYAMGDGNHSLATAKTIWETLKSGAKDKDAVMRHPARFALVELVNVHDPGLEFEPIHRVVFDTDPDALIKAMGAFFGGDFSVRAMKGRAEALQAARKCRGACHCIPFSAGKAFGVISVGRPKLTLEVATLQSFLDQYLAKNKQAKIDYIHGGDVVASLSAQRRAIGFYLPPMDKSDLFKTVILDGALPRKTFSMGEASEKRFYLECRKIA